MHASDPTEKRQIFTDASGKAAAKLFLLTL